MPDSIHCSYFKYTKHNKINSNKGFRHAIFLFFASFCNPELVASENNVRVDDLRTVGKVMAE